MNLELLNRVHKQIETQPDTWNQALWIQQADCGTTACVAGWASLLSGWEPANQHPAFGVDMVEKQARRLHVQEAAWGELGLNEEQAAYLFNEYRTRKQIDRFVERANAGQDPVPQSWRMNRAFLAES